MKKIFYFIASAIVALGAVACQNEIDENIDKNQQTEGVSFYAEVKDITRVDIGNKTESGYPVIWEVNDALEVSWYDEVAEEPHTYLFVYDGEKFTCNEDGVEILKGKDVTVNYYASIYGYDSAKGKKGMMLGTNDTVTFTPDCTINMELQCAFFHFSSSENVVLTVEGGDDKAFYYNEELTASTPELTGEDIWVPFYVYAGTVAGTDLTLTASIDGEVVKQITRNFANGKIYNLGTIEAPVEPASNAYLVPGVWNTDGAWFAAYFFNKAASVQTRAAATEAWVKMTDADANGVFECEIPAGFNSVIFCRMNPAFNELAWDAEGVAEDKKKVWNQSADLTLPLVDDNNRYCYINGWDSPATWGENPFAPETPGVASKWCATGGFNSWGDTNVMVTTTVKNLFVAKNITLAAYGEFKIKVKGSWDGSYGAGDICYLNQNVKVASFVNGSNFQNVVAGTYDIYFDALSGSVYLMTAGTDYTTATAQTTNGAMPDMSNVKWGLCGVHNNWGGSADIALTWDGTIGLYVAKNAKLTGEFKVRANQDWATSFGSGGSITVNKAAATTVYNNGGNMKVTSGTYDVYFWYDTKNIKANGKIWVKTPGSAAPTL